jgi:hypothetical protein
LAAGRFFATELDSYFNSTYGIDVEFNVDGTIKALTKIRDEGEILKKF